MWIHFMFAGMFMDTSAGSVKLTAWSITVTLNY